MLSWISFISAPLASPTSTSQTTALETLDKIQSCPPMPNLGSRRDSGRGEDSKGGKEEVAHGQVKLKACRAPIGFSPAPNPDPVPGLLQDTLAVLTHPC